MSVIVQDIMSVEAAQAVTNRIRIALDGTWELIRDAYIGRAWIALGYESWDAYTDAEFQSSRLRLPREERQQAVASLRDSGLSIRAIASGLGIGDKTVQRDLAAGVVTDYTSPEAPVPSRNVAPAPVETFDADGILIDAATGEVIEDAPTVTEHTVTEKVKTVTGLDGKEYKRPAPKPRAEAITAQFTSAISELNRVMARLRRIRDDKNFARNKEQIASLHASDLSRTVSELETLADLIS